MSRQYQTVSSYTGLLNVNVELGRETCTSRVIK